MTVRRPAIVILFFACLASRGWTAGGPTPDYRVKLSAPSVVNAGDEYSYVPGGAVTRTIPNDLTAVRASMAYGRLEPGVLAFGPYPPVPVVDVIDRAPVVSRLMPAVGATNPYRADLNSTNNVIAQTSVRLPRNRGAVPRPPSPPAGKSLVWVGAHPDDEILIAGSMGPACVHASSICTLVIATRGEKGDCLLTGGCSPDLGSVRENEFRNAAAILDAEPRVGDLPDGSGGTAEEVLQRWSAVVGGRQYLIATLVDIFRTRAADVVITFDPRHGSTCHPDHRAVGELTLEAVQSMGSQAPALWFLEDVVEFAPGFSSAELSPAANDPGTLTTVDLTAPDGSSVPWDFVLAVVGAHPSQNLASAFASIAEADRKLYLLALWRFDPTDPRYDKCLSE